ncbi:hypothetical protein P152DRAFT_488418 [Eremomyces bilateralis CBS 781.70]|uniref:Uncharacterized protein n=1 Tax=Eremomyces bilateralis CBS 781.70 TaxID=1392243 RepID=A0A6G1G1W2_9PEZI|nr:uncharacterized protein P152DRAFT_488418 [Eremomyces bilateralis CBS 781.70]KAF1812044.1 hypothetical protein P152DRAFT_488418 [Eremomyces bilateralis CBS 781.70]
MLFTSLPPSLPLSLSPSQTPTTSSLHRSALITLILYSFQFLLALPLAAFISASAEFAPLRGAGDKYPYHSGREKLRRTPTPQAFTPSHFFGLATGTVTSDEHYVTIDRNQLTLGSRFSLHQQLRHLMATEASFNTYRLFIESSYRRENIANQTSRIQYLTHSTRSINITISSGLDVTETGNTAPGQDIVLKATHYIVGVLPISSHDIGLQPDLRISARHLLE